MHNVHNYPAQDKRCKSSSELKRSSVFYSGRRVVRLNQLRMAKAQLHSGLLLKILQDLLRISGDCPPA